jgi:hypothetical protein
VASRITVEEQHVAGAAMRIGGIVAAELGDHPPVVNAGGDDGDRLAVRFEGFQHPALRAAFRAFDEQFGKEVLHIGIGEDVVNALFPELLRLQRKEPFEQVRHVVGFHVGHEAVSADLSEFAFLLAETFAFALGGMARQHGVETALQRKGERNGLGLTAEFSKTKGLGTPRQSSS